MINLIYFLLLYIFVTICSIPSMGLVTCPTVQILRVLLLLLYLKLTPFSNLIHFLYFFSAFFLHSTCNHLTYHISYLFVLFSIFLPPLKYRLYQGSSFCQFCPLPDLIFVVQMWLNISPSLSRSVRTLNVTGPRLEYSTFYQRLLPLTRLLLIFWSLTNPLNVISNQPNLSSLYLESIKEFVTVFFVLFCIVLFVCLGVFG